MDVDVRPFTLVGTVVERLFQVVPRADLVVGLILEIKDHVLVVQGQQLRLLLETCR